MSRLLAALALIGLLVVAAPGARAEPSCDPVEAVVPLQYQRQLTLDLWGRVPTVAEMEAVLAEGAVTPERVDAMLQDPRFFEYFASRHHRDLLWPNIDQVTLASPAFNLLLPAMFYELEGDPERLFVLYVGLYERGGLVPCKDEPAEFDEDGEIVLEEYPDGTLRDGWVMVEPYWAPGTQVKVCALEARALETAPNGEACSEFGGMATGGCGCGEHLERCLSIASSGAVRDAFQEQTLRAVARALQDGASYFDMLTRVETELDGRLVHYYRHLAQLAVDPTIAIPPVPAPLLPDKPWDDTTWETFDRKPVHSGVLTSMLYLLRFQTARARANRFWSAFLCAPFQAPGTDLPSPNDPCSQEPNLRERCGCNGCHSVLEPASAYWARFTDAGTLYMDPALFPTYRADCIGRPEGEDFFCDRWYLKQAGHPAEEPFVGMLKSHVWRPATELADMEAGPGRLVEDKIADGSLPRCTAQKVFERLHGRDMTFEERQDLLPDVVAAFEASGWDFRALVEAWVTAESYRRMIR